MHVARSRSLGTPPQSLTTVMIFGPLLQVLALPPLLQLALLHPPLSLLLRRLLADQPPNRQQFRYSPLQLHCLHRRTNSSPRLLPPLLPPRWICRSRLLCVTMTMTVMMTGETTGLVAAVGAALVALLLTAAAKTMRTGQSATFLLRTNALSLCRAAHALRLQRFAAAAEAAAAVVASGHHHVTVVFWRQLDLEHPALEAQSQPRVVDTCRQRQRPLYRWQASEMCLHALLRRGLADTAALTLLPLLQLRGRSMRLLPANSHTHHRRLSQQMQAERAELQLQLPPLLRSAAVLPTAQLQVAVSNARCGPSVPLRWPSTP